ncbi:peptidase-C39 like family protein [Ekhidna sp.]|uniref:peptidase-C39 like family protein n=1 Tax=Ekhidna sp. TaxID=2608089 RepID=UPI003519C8A9
MLLKEEKKYLKILPQPTDVSCGPTSLHAVYNFYGDKLALEKVIDEVKQVSGGGTLAVMLANHALKRGYETTIYTNNLQVFDPTWFQGGVDIAEKLKEQMRYKKTKRMAQASEAYLAFLKAGGKLMFDELSPDLLKKFLLNKIPVLTGLSATYLYQSSREIGETNVYHDTKGEPSGHFVVLSDYDQVTDKVLIADPLDPNPISDTNQYYAVKIQRVVNAILLGIVTYDANLLIIQPKKHAKINSN